MLSHPAIFVLLASCLMLGGPWAGLLSAQDVVMSLTIANEAPLVDLNGAPSGVDAQANYVVGMGPMAIVSRSDLSITDQTDGTLAEVRVQLVNQPDGPDETLDVTVSGGVSKIWDPLSGTLICSGPASPATFTTILRTLTYRNARLSPNLTARTVEVVANDGQLTSAVATSVVSLLGSLPNVPPTVDLAITGSLTWTEGDAPLRFAPSAVVTNPDSPTFSGGTCSVSFTSNGENGDRVAIAPGDFGDGLIALSGATLTRAGNPIATWVGGDWPQPLVVTFTSVSTAADVQAVVRALSYHHPLPAPTASLRGLNIAVIDDMGNVAPGQIATISVQPLPPPIEIRPLTVATGTGSLVSGQVAILSGDPATTRFSVVTNPQYGRLTTFDQQTGAFVYQADVGAASADSFTVVATDAYATSAPLTVHIALTNPRSPSRLWISSRPPLEAQLGDRLTWTVRVDVSDLPAAPDLQFAVDNPPAGMFCLVDRAHGTADIIWPSVAGSDHVQFYVRVWNSQSLVSDVQPVCVYVHPAATTIAAISPAAADGSWKPTRMSVSLLSVVGLIGVVLGSMMRRQGNSGKHKSVRIERKNDRRRP